MICTGCGLDVKCVLKWLELCTWYGKETENIILKLFLRLTHFFVNGIFPRAIFRWLISVYDVQYTTTQYCSQVERYKGIFNNNSDDGNVAALLLLGYSFPPLYSSFAWSLQKMEYFNNSVNGSWLMVIGLFVQAKVIETSGIYWCWNLWWWCVCYMIIYDEDDIINTLFLISILVGTLQFYYGA